MDFPQLSDDQTKHFDTTKVEEDVSSKIGNLLRKQKSILINYLCQRQRGLMGLVLNC